MRSFPPSKRGLWRVGGTECFQTFLSEVCSNTCVDTMHTRGTFPSHFRIPMMEGINYWYLQTMGGKNGFSRSELLQFSPSSATLQPHLNPSPLTATAPYVPQSPFLLTVLEVSLNRGLSSSHQPPFSPPSPLPIPSVWATNTSYL